jgi:Protoglobin
MPDKLQAPPAIVSFAGLVGDRRVSPPLFRPLPRPPPGQGHQHDIGRRRHRTKKNRTDGAASTPIVPFKDLFLLVFTVTFTLKPFLANKGHSAEDVEKMCAAWVKSCLVQVTLWSHPYVKDGDF